MDPEKNALDQFNDDFPVVDNTRDPFNELKPVEKTEQGEDEEEVIEPKKNRHTRRLEEKLQREREANIELATRLRTLSEMRQEDESTVAPDIARIYGTDTPEAREATRILQAALEKVKEDAKMSALEEFSQSQQDAMAEQQEAETFIDSELEALEDEYSIDLTSDKPEAKKARAEFLGLVHKLSPKDDAGNVKDYADFEQAFEIYQSTREKQTPNRAKELASRAMTKSSSAPTQTVGDKAQQDYLRSIGII